MKVDLDVDSTVIIKADLDQGGWYYWIDKNACVCWVGGTNGANSPVATSFHCENLKAHKKLADHVKNCGPGGSVVISVEAKAERANEAKAERANEASAEHSGEPTKSQENPPAATSPAPTPAAEAAAPKPSN